MVIKLNNLPILLVGLGKMFVECDLSLFEINPLVITKARQFIVFRWQN